MQSLDDYLTPKGFKFLGRDRSGQWGKFVRADGDEIDPDELKRRREAREAKEQARLLRLKGGLTNEERDKTIRALHRRLGLTQAHRRHLIEDRGFKPEQVERGLFFSVARGQDLSIPIDPRFPGATADGKGLCVSGNGIAIPVFNSDGLAIGYQVRLDEAENGRYRWGKSWGNGATSHLQNGELPLMFAKPDRVVREGIGLCESVGFKPLLTAQKFGHPVIGAAGGNFLSSPQQLEAYLEAAESKRVVLYPDAGAMGNPHVKRQYQRTINQIRDWGYEVAIAWWNQDEKSAPDPDELESIEGVEFRPATDFFPNTAGKSEMVEIDPEQEAKRKKEEERKTAYREKKQREVAEKQKKLNTLSLKPDIELDCEFLPDDLWKSKLLHQDGFIFVKSRKGSGKSKAILKPLIKWAKDGGKRVLSITPRVVLGKEQCEKFDLLWVDELGCQEATIAQQLGGSCCWDSLWKIADQPWDVLILDEARLGLKHLATANTAVSYRRGQILRNFSELAGDIANRGGRVIAADADLTNVEVDYLRSHAPNAPVFTVLNHHKGQGREIEFMTGKRAELEDRIVQAADAQVEAYQAGEPVQPFAVASDSQKELEALDRLLVETYPELAQKILRIDKKTTEEDWAKEFVANIDESIEAIKPWVLLWSPSMSVGVSIERGYFSRIYGMYFGVLEPCEFRQQLARYRPDCPVSLWAKEESNMSSGSRSFDPDEILRHMKESSKGGAEDAIDMATEIARGEADGDMDKFMEVLNNLYKRGSWDNSHMKLFANIKARENYARPQCGLQLRQELMDEENATIIDSVGDDAAISEEIKGEKADIDFEYASTLHEGAESPMTADEAKEIKQNPGTKWAERAQADGVLLRESLPGVNLSPDWIYKNKVRSRQWLGQLRLYWAAKNLARTQASDALKLKKRVTQMLEGADCYLPDFRLKGAAVKAIAESGILALESIDEYCAKSPEVKAITKWAKANRKFIYHEFGLSLDPKNPIRFVGNLLKKLGLKQAKLRQDGQGQRWYAVAGALDPDRRAVLCSWDEKYLAMCGEIAAFGEVETGEVKYGGCALNLRYYRRRFEQAAERELQGDLASAPEWRERDYQDAADLIAAAISPRDRNSSPAERIKLVVEAIGFGKFYGAIDWLSREAIAKFWNLAESDREFAAAIAF
jgi:hypothetical protein